tara:strand:+ start:5115 stop:6188 length:1074 start_codon:yes stop_codon:yes gene_type:complete
MARSDVSLPKENSTTKPPVFPVEADSRSPFNFWMLRRLITIPSFSLAFVVITIGAPVLFLATTFWDIQRKRKNLPLTRVILLTWFYLVVEILTIVGCLIDRMFCIGGSKTSLSLNNVLIRFWSSCLFWGAVKVFGLRVFVEGIPPTKDGPILLFSRHVSPVDNLIPSVFVSNPNRLHIRTALNRWLLRDPSIDLVSHRIPTAFIRVGDQKRPRHLKEVAALGRNLEAHDVVLLFPEGTLFNERKRSQIINRFRKNNNKALAERAESFRNVLLPRTGGPLALLKNSPEADVIFLAHTGLELGTYLQAARGGLMRKELHIRLWRVSREEIPENDEDRIDWLYDQWKRVDDWIEEKKAVV